MALNNTGEISLGGSNAPTSVNLELSKVATAIVSLNDTDVRNLAGIVSGQISMSDLRGKSSNPKQFQKAIFGFGVIKSLSNSITSTETSITNLVSNTGAVATDTINSSIVGKGDRAAAGYGGDKAIFGFGTNKAMAGAVTNISNLVSNTGVVGNDVATVGQQRSTLAGAGYGLDKAIFGYGSSGGYLSVTNLVTNTGTVGNNVTGVGTARYGLAAAGYGLDKAIFGYGLAESYYTGTSPVSSITNLVSNTGVVVNNATLTGVGTGRQYLAAAGYGFDKAIFAYGEQKDVNYTALSNLVSNTGTVANDVSIAGRGRGRLAGTGYGGDKAIFGYGTDSSSALVEATSETNLVTNTGTVGNSVTGVGRARYGVSGACFG